MSKLQKILLSCLLILIAITASYGGMFLAFLNRTHMPAKPVVLLVKPGMSFHTVANELHRQGVVPDLFLFQLLARLRGAAEEIKAGEYDFRTMSTPGQILDRLVAGDVRRYKLTIPEGFNLMEIGARIGKAEITSAEQLLVIAADPAFLATLELNANSLEGYLFPETYTYVSGAPIKPLLTAMVEQFRKRLLPEVIAGAAAHGLNEHQLVTLASIIQKEAGNNDEMPLIAAVFLNRLQ